MSGSGQGEGGAKQWIARRLTAIAPLITLGFLIVIFSVMSPSFATVDNLSNILRQVSITAIIATGLTFIILTAEIDLSVASVANAVGIVVAYFTMQEAYVNIANLPLPGGFAIILALLAALALGAITATGVTVIGIPSFIMTLAMLQIGAGICAMLVRGQIAYNVPPLIKFLGSGYVGPVPVIVIVAAVFLAVGHFVLTYTRFGRYVFPHGRRQSRGGGFSGVNASAHRRFGDDHRCRLLGHRRHAGCRLLRQRSAEPVRRFPPRSIAAVVVGGTSLFGGVGGIPNTIIGLFVLGVLNNGLDHIDIDSFLKVLIRGLILLLALIINVYAQRLRAR
ncbi:MAG: ABC transporter permease [Geminicoccaceae bacterium]